MGGQTPAELDALREKHRPDAAGLRREALRLLRDGWTPADVSHALRVPNIVVREWQGAP